MFCTRWNGLEKGSIFDDALDDKEYEGNLIYLLKSGSEFIRNNSKVRFVKEAKKDLFVWNTVYPAGTGDLWISSGFQ